MKINIGLWRNSAFIGKDVSKHNDVVYVDVV